VLRVLAQPALPQELHPLLIELGEFGLDVHELQQGVEGILARRNIVDCPSVNAAAVTGK
jgi:hypothetical protein